MAIQYAGGTIVDALIAADDRPTLATAIKDQLVLAGWTLAVEGTNDYKLDSAITPQNLQMRVRVRDTGAGNGVRIYCSNATETIVQINYLPLLVGAAKTYRIIANKYQAFVLGSPSTAREFVSWGVPYLPPHLVAAGLTQAIWTNCNAADDSDAYVRGSLRTRLGSTYNSGAASFLVTNSSVIDTYTSFAGNEGLLLPGMHGSNLTTAINIFSGMKWFGGSVIMWEPLLCWGNQKGASEEGTIKGQIWDAVVVGDSFAADSIISVDGRTFRNITADNGGRTDMFFAKGSLFVAAS